MVKSSLGKVLCPRSVGPKWHMMQCLRGDCEDCGFDKIPVCTMDVQPNNLWRRFEMVPIGTNRKEEPKIAINLEYKLTGTYFFSIC